MLFLDVLTILCAGLMIGNELTVSLFINPVVWIVGESCRSWSRWSVSFRGLSGNVESLGLLKGPMNVILKR
jgi:hypothetical protein